MHCTRTTTNLPNVTTTQGAAGCNRLRPFLFHLGRVPHGDDARDDAGDGIAKSLGLTHHAASFEADSVIATS
jgi:hypothetical protein